MSQTIPRDTCLTVVQASRFLRCRPTTIRQLIRSGQLRAIIIGNRPRISPAALAEFEAAAAARPAPARARRESVPSEVVEILGGD